MRIDGYSLPRLTTPGELQRPATPGERAPQALGETAVSAGGGQPTAGSGGPTGSFSGVLGKAMGQVNDLLQQADVQAQRVATGDAQNLHESMLAMAEADIALQVTMRVVQKAVAAYQEVSRMQV